MRLKNLVIVFICACLFIFSTTSASYAANAWYVADIISVSSGSWYQVVLKNVAPRSNPENIIRDKTVAFLQADKEKELLAVFLTAQSLGEQVEVYFDAYNYDPGSGVFPTVFVVQIVSGQ